MPSNFLEAILYRTRTRAVKRKGNRIMKAARFVLFAVMALALSGFASEGIAQTKKKKTPPKPKTVAVVPPSSTDAQIVSRAEDFLSEDDGTGTQTAAATGNTSTQQPETVDERVEKADKRIKDLNA